MFTGIVQYTGTLATREKLEGDLRLGVDVSADLAARMAVGASVALNGVCLTVAARDGDRLLLDVSVETTSRTRLGDLAAGASVNLEAALSAADPVGGHFVTGHVDGVGEVLRIEPEGRSRRMEVRAPESLMRYVAVKGSIAVDGVSLTVNEIKDDAFGFNVVPHTWSATNMHTFTAGTLVHLEVDLIARYLERLVGGREAASPDSDITADYLSRQGFAPPVMDDEDEDAEARDDPPDNAAPDRNDT